MTDTGLLDVLQEIGLTEYQSRAYVASVNLGTARFSDLAEESDIPQQRIYDVVEDLENLGLVEVHQGGKGKQAVAVPPETSLTELKEQHIDEYASNVQNAIDSLDHQYEQVDTSLGFVTVVNHETSVRRHVRDALESAKWWVFLSLPVDWYREVEADIETVLARDVSVNLLIQAEDPSVAETVDYPTDMDVRYRPSADLVVAADRSYGVFRGIAAPSVARPSLVTADENIVAMLQRYSKQFWTPSRRIQSSQRLPRRYLSPWELIVDLENDQPTDDDLTVYVEGHETSTGRVGSWEGPLLDYEYEPELGSKKEMTMPEVARLRLETDEGVVTVGGWDARLEDVAAHGLELRSG